MMMEIETKDGKMILKDDGTIVLSDNLFKKSSKQFDEELPDNISQIEKEK